MYKAVTLIIYIGDSITLWRYYLTKAKSFHIYPIAMITVTGDRDRDRESTTCLTKTRHVAQIMLILIVALTFDILGAAALLHAVERGLQ